MRIETKDAATNRLARIEDQVRDVSEMIAGNRAKNLQLCLAAARSNDTPYPIPVFLP
jgi:DNA-binding FrmR family transcriptional regulator